MTARGRRARTLALACALAAVVAPTDRAVADEADLLVRILTEGAEVRTGPGFVHRPVYRAARGEVLRAIGRSTADHWYRVVLPDGTYGWVLGDQVFPLEVDPSAPPHKPGFFERVADAIFAPPPLLSGSVELTFSVGMLGGEGMALFRPAVILEPHVAIEGFIGETVGDQLDVLYYGAGATLTLFPASPVTPFLAAGGGGARGRKKADIFTLPGHLASANVGGGLLVAFKKRLTLRFDARHYVVFDADHTQDLREYSGGLVVVF